MSVWLSEDYTRAAQGGTGFAKCGGNYAASLLAQAEATRHGCDQVVFLDAAERRWVEELGGMNVFFVFDDGSGTSFGYDLEEIFVSVSVPFSNNTATGNSQFDFYKLGAGCADGWADNVFSTDIVSLMFEVALIVLLLHPQSREYERIWFK